MVVKILHFISRDFYAVVSFPDFCAPEEFKTERGMTAQSFGGLFVARWAYEPTAAAQDLAIAWLLAATWK